MRPVRSASNRLGFPSGPCPNELLDIIGRNSISDFFAILWIYARPLCIPAEVSQASASPKQLSTRIGGRAGSVSRPYDCASVETRISYQNASLQTVDDVSIGGLLAASTFLCMLSEVDQNAIRVFER
jgi:hypothetical protein